MIDTLLQPFTFPFMRDAFLIAAVVMWRRTPTP